MKNLPVVPWGQKPPENETYILSLPEIPSPDYARIRALAETLPDPSPRPLLVCLEQDMAKALGQALALRRPPGAPIACIDRIRMPAGSFLDIAAPIGPALPVVVKTLVLSH